MENSKLKVPLFYDSSFNRDGHRMRAVFEREITNGTETYHLWRSAGKPDVGYPRAENDAYILHAEINSYLMPLGMTDYALITQCGFKAAEKKLYGGMKERGQYFNALRKCDGDAAVNSALETEQREAEVLGNDPAVQADYIRDMLAKRVSDYLTAKANGGQTFPDFYGAAILNDLHKCVELAAVYRAAQREKNLAQAARAEEEERIFCEERNQEVEQTVADVVQIILDGGVLKNETVQLYRSKYDYSAYSIINYLMRLYQVDVPLRTQGWINEKLSSVTIMDGKCESLRYRRAKNGRCSQKFFEFMDDLIQAVKASMPEPDRREVA